MKTRVLTLFVVLTIVASCNTKQNNSENSEINFEKYQNQSENQENNYDYSETEITEDFNDEIEEQTAKCVFETDSDVLQYLIGKTFRQKGGGTYITFSYDGANLAGKRDYQWLSYESLGGFKGVVKLASTSMDNPDGVLTLWVSCRENAVTDGNLVLLY